MTFNDINQFNVIDNQASMFFSRVLRRMANPSQTYCTYITLVSLADLESTHIFTLETMFGCTYLQDFIFFSCVPVGVELPKYSIYIFKCLNINYNKD